MQRMQTDPPAGVSASPIADNVMTWYGAPIHPRTRLPHQGALLRNAGLLYWRNFSRSGANLVLTLKQERSHHRPCRHALRGRDIPLSYAL